MSQPHQQALYTGRRMSADEYLALGETLDRYELIEGVVVEAERPSVLHQRVVFEVATQLAEFRHENSEVRIFPSTDLRLSDRTVYCPDISVYAPRRLPRIPARLTEPPDLVVEILSPRTRPLDLVTKRGDYDRFGVGEYWVVDPATGGVRCWARSSVGMEERPVESPRLESAAIEGLSLDLTALQRVVGEARD